MIGPLIFVAVSIGSLPAGSSACAAREPQLEVVRRPIPVRYTIEDPTHKQAVGVVVFEVKVGEHGKVAKIATVCSTAGPQAARAAVQAVRTWQFRAPAHSIGQLELRFTDREP